ncbi:hypothetical protein SAMN07250955_105102 [Arboricoccus pini]|uniref:Uncharacterized protein n=1 Tax=Arboricoccus pini TaxID=1963835 RepID=A0A212R3M1_9PROT|nr:hypothetical protein SAMN07250955_105102 [Arboricoccus pini]
MAYAARNLSCPLYVNGRTLWHCRMCDRSTTVVTTGYLNETVSIAPH